MTIDAAAGPERKAPGRPRSAQAEKAIIDAVIALLRDGQSADALSMEAVATRAGVGKATIYRRWPNKDALLIDAVKTLKGPVPEPAGDNVRDDLITCVSSARRRADEGYSAVTATLMPEFFKQSELGRAYQAAIEPRREVMRQVLQRGVSTGELRADLDIELTMLLLSGSNVVQNMLRWNPRIPEEDFAEHLVDAVLRGAAAC